MAYQWFAGVVNKLTDVTICFRISAMQECFFYIRVPQNDISAAIHKTLMPFISFSFAVIIPSPQGLFTWLTFSSLHCHKIKRSFVLLFIFPLREKRLFSASDDDKHRPMPQRHHGRWKNHRKRWPGAVPRACARQERRRVGRQRPWDFPYLSVYQQDEIADGALAYYDLSKRRYVWRDIITRCNLSTWNDFCQVVHRCLDGVAVSRRCVIHPALTINRLYFNHDRYARISADIP